MRARASSIAMAATASRAPTPSLGALLKIALPCGLAGAVLILIAAEIAPWVLGPSFKSSTPMLRVLALLPIIQSIHYVYSDALTAAGLQQLRTRLQWLVAAVYAVLAFALVPTFGWQGAVAVCLVSGVPVGRARRSCGSTAASNRSGATMNTKQKDPDADPRVPAVSRRRRAGIAGASPLRRRRAGHSGDGTCACACDASLRPLPGSARREGGALHGGSCSISASCPPSNNS